MTSHVHAPVLRSNAEIAEKAKNIHPLRFTGRLLLTIVTGVFVSLGWVAGRSWFVVVFTALWTASRLAWLGQCTRMGYHQGRKSKITPRE